MAQQLLYIHGFNSSRLSAKAQLLERYFAAHRTKGYLTLPSLPVAPRKSVEQLESHIADCSDTVLVGSSLGGFYATYLAEKHGLAAILINPAMRPWELLDKYTGIQHNYHTGEPWQFDPSWVEDLRQFEVTQLTHPDNIMLLVQTDDDTLDWADSWYFYRTCHCFKGVGGSHGFDNFDAFIPLVLRFAGMDSN